MFPSSHVAIGYLLYSAYSHLRFRRSPGEFAAFLAFLAALLPDLIDKPLWLAGVVTWGRAVGHSFLLILPLTAVVGCIIYVKRGETDATVAFGLGIVAASIFDGIGQFMQGSLSGDLEEVSFWVWPLHVPAGRIVEHLKFIPLAEHVIVHKASWMAENIPRQPELGIWLRVFEVSVTLLALCMWFQDGVPGWETFRYLSKRAGRLAGT